MAEVNRSAQRRAQRHVTLKSDVLAGVSGRSGSHRRQIRRIWWDCCSRERNRDGEAATTAKVSPFASSTSRSRDCGAEAAALSLYGDRHRARRGPVLSRGEASARDAARAEVRYEERSIPTSSAKEHRPRPMPPWIASPSSCSWHDRRDSRARADTRQAALPPAQRNCFGARGS